MTCKQFIGIGLMIIAFMCNFSQNGNAANHQADLRVSAVVESWFKAQTTQQAVSYQVTGADVVRGYIDLSSAISLHIQTNIPQGKILFHVVNSGVEQVLLKEPGDVNGQLLINVNSGIRSEVRSYDLRVIIPPDVVAGTYPLHLFMQTTVL